jgi:hypothetical protein
LVTKAKSNEIITKASLKLKQRIPLSPKALPNNLQTEEDMQDLVTLGQIKVEKKKTLSNCFLQQGSKCKPPSRKIICHLGWFAAKVDIIKDVLWSKK